MTPDLTVFVGTFNRTDTLAGCIKHLERQWRPKRIVVVDNGSRHPDAVAYLQTLDHAVYEFPGINDLPPEPGDEDAHGGPAMQAVRRNYGRAFRIEWETEPRPRWYAVCDCDTWLDGPPHTLDIYVYLAEKTGRDVGPHLRLNVHRNYPLRSLALIQHARTLFRDHMTYDAGVPWSPDEIDTTFHLFPATPVYPRAGMNMGRVGPPWWATHSDWLIDFTKPTVENHAYILGSGDAASWAGGWIRGVFAAWLDSPEAAYELVSATDRANDDYFPESFILSWMLQYGHGCEPDPDRSRQALRDGVPAWSPCWAYEQYWDDLVYRDDQTCLGWTS